MRPLAAAHIVLPAVLILFLVPSPAATSDAEAEIDFLLQAVGDSGCTFLRNGEMHSSHDAEQHLRMKYRRGKRYASTTEQFIEMLASGSSMTKRPYLIACGDAEPMETEKWLTERLERYRGVD